MNEQKNIKKDIVDMLAAYVAIQTVKNDIASYDKAIELFIQYAKKDGFSYQKIVLDSGLPMLIISLEGSDDSLKSLVLNHHMDVVCAEEGGWVVPPFAGIVFDNKLYGRGTQDMKGVGVCHYYALRQIAFCGKKPKRTVHLIMVPDEEQGGFKGTGAFINMSVFRKLNIGYVIDEGMPSGVENAFFISIAERKPLQINITVKGISGHGSMLVHYNAAHTLLAILNQFMALHNESVAQCNEDKVGSGDHGALNSFHVTSICTYPLDASLNTIPSSASATIDIRVAPQNSMQNVIEKINSIISLYKDAEWHIIAMAQDCTYNSQANLLEQCFEKVFIEKKYVLKKHVFEGATDMRFYRKLGIEAIGCTPFSDPSLLHAANEYVSLRSLDEGSSIFLALLKEFCYGDLVR